MPVPHGVDFDVQRTTFQLVGAQVAAVVIAAPGVGSMLRVLGFHISGASKLYFTSAVVNGLASGATEDTRTPNADPGVGVNGGDNEALLIDSPGDVSGEILYTVVT